MTAAFKPRFNHVAITMDPGLLDEAGRADLLDFFGTVFGWTEGDNTGESGNPLILYTGAPMQFLYLLPGEPALPCPALDHLGLEVASVAELEALVERARAFGADDPRVRIIEVTERITHGARDDFVLTSAYLGFVLPLMIELQHLDRRPRAPT
jgi:hypothetical protein